MVNNTSSKPSGGVVRVDTLGKSGGSARTGVASGSGGYAQTSQETSERMQPASSRVVYEEIKTPQGGSLGQKAVTRIDVRSGGREGTITDLNTGERQDFRSDTRISAGDVSVPEKGIKSYSEQRYNKLIKEKRQEEKTINDRLKGLQAQKNSGLLTEIGKQRVEKEIKELNETIKNVRKDEPLPLKLKLKQEYLPESFKYKLPKDSGERLSKTFEKIIQQSNFKEYIALINSKQYKRYIDDKATIKDLATQYNFATDKLELAKKENRKDLIKKYKNEIRKIYVKSAIDRLKRTTYSQKVEKANELMSKSKNWNFVINILEKAGEKDAKKLINNIKNNPNYGKFKQNIILSKIGVSRIPIKTLSIITGSEESEVRKKPYTLAQNTAGVLLTRDVLKKGLKVGVKNKVISALTQLGGYGLLGAYTKQKATEFKKATNKDKFISNTVAELTLYGYIFKGIGNKQKQSFSFKETGAKLFSPFYKSDLKLLESTPQTTPSKLLEMTQRKGEKGNFYHTTTGKYKDFVKGKILTILEQKTGVGKDRLKFNENFLYVSDKGLVEYGIKGTKPVIKFKLEKEALKLFKGSLRKYQSSDILKQIERKQVETKRGKISVRNENDRLMIDFLKNNKDNVVSGQRASNLQSGFLYRRKTIDWDIKTNKPSDNAKKFIDKANSLYPDRYKIKILETPDGKVYRIYDTKFKDIIGDFGKIKENIPIKNIKGFNVADTSYLIDRKISTLIDVKKRFRWDKDFKDLKSLLKTTKQYKPNKLLIKNFEKNILNGKIDISKARTIIKEFKGFGLSKPTIKYLLNANKNPVKFGLMKLLFKPILTKKPNTYKILEFNKLNLLNYPKALLERIKLSESGKLSTKQKIQLRLDLVEYIKNNPNKVAAGSKSLSNMPIPYGLEEEWQIAVGSKFKAQKNIRSSFYKIFGITKGESIIYDKSLDKIIQIYRFSDAKDATKKQLEIKFLLKSLKDKYKNPKQLLKDIFKEDIKTPSQLRNAINQRTRNNPTLLQQRYLPFFRKNNNIFLKESPRVSLVKLVRERDKPLFSREYLLNERPREIRPTELKPREIQLERIREQRLIEPTTRTTRLMERPRETKPVIIPKRIIKREKPNKEPKPKKEEETKKPPITFPKSELKKAIAQIRKKKYTKFQFQYTPTLAGIDQRALRTSGQFIGLEVRGNIIKPILVHKHKRSNLVNKQFVRKHHRAKIKRKYV